MARWLLGGLLAIAGCGHSAPSGGGDGGHDLAAADLSALPGDASGIDQAVGPDLTGAMTCGGFGGLPCPMGQFCDTPNCGAADETGVCITPPAACGKVYQPVCGCDGKTYGNDCLRQMAGVSLQHTGTCDGTCTVDTDCMPGQLCCYPCGIPGCNLMCTTPLNGKCPMPP